jgi:Domain of unknown function (DUF4407)
MTTDLNGKAPAPGAVSTTMPLKSLPADPYRPARPNYGPGRWFRICAGIQEDVMDWTPSERAKYAGFGIIIFNTGCLAALAMFTALGKIISAPWYALVPVALIWGWMIFSVDRWLVTSTHGILGINRVLIFIPRLFLAALLAFTIAEPLTLRIFQNTLDSTVATTRTTQLDSYESLLQTCNPVSGASVLSAACVGNHLNVPDSPYAAQQQLQLAKQQEAQLQSAVNGAQAQYQQATTRAEGECTGTAGTDMTGQPGDGPMCKKDFALANSAQASLTTKQQALSAQQGLVEAMNRQSGGAQQVYTAKLSAAITAAVNVRRQDLNQQIGIIDEWAALEQLSDQSAFVFFGHWLLVLVMMALDCLPVLGKLMSGSSGYDRLLAKQRASDEHIYDIDLQFRNETATIDQEVGIYLAQNWKRDRISSLKREERVREARVDTDGLDDVRATAAQWLREAGGVEAV